MITTVVYDHSGRSGTSLFLTGSASAKPVDQATQHQLRQRGWSEAGSAAQGQN